MDFIQSFTEDLFQEKNKGDNFSYHSYGFEKLKKGLFSSLKVTAKEIPFLFIAGLLFLGLIIGGLYELFFTTPLNKWFIDILNSVLQLSPQDIVNESSQIPTNDLMQRTIGDWLGLAPNLWKQLISIIIAPIDVILGIIFIVTAVIVRLGRHILGFIPIISPFKHKVETISWTILALGLLPSALDFFIW